jgi:hypothetical protein
MNQISVYILFISVEKKKRVRMLFTTLLGAYHCEGMAQVNEFMAAVVAVGFTVLVVSCL